MGAAPLSSLRSCVCSCQRPDSSRPDDSFTDTPPVLGPGRCDLNPVISSLQKGPHFAGGTSPPALNCGNSGDDVNDGEITAAESALADIETARKLHIVLQAALTSSDASVEDLLSSIQAADSAGVSSSTLVEARNFVEERRRHARSALFTAKSDKVPESLREALKAARLAFLGADEIADAEAVLQEMTLGIWEEEPTGDPRKNSWRRLPDDQSRSTEKLFSIYDGCKGKHGRRGNISEHCTVDFLLMTCQKKQPSKVKSVTMPIRRLHPQTLAQTHPNPEQNHPWFDKKVALLEKEGDWLSNDYFWRAFCECCRKAGREVISKPEELFDFQHNRDYRSWDGALKETRGGLEYTIPKGWKRFACRVKDKFGSDNTWLRLDGGPGEWAIAYHGTSYEALVPILDGGLKAGAAQVYKDKKDARTGHTIGVGVYCTPSIFVAQSYASLRGDKTGTSIDGHNVHFVLQCRVMPERIKRCQDERDDDNAYWVLNDAGHIRPYGILVKQAN